MRLFLLLFLSSVLIHCEGKKTNIVKSKKSNTPPITKKASAEKKEQKLELFYDSVKILSKYGLKNKIKIGIEAIVGHVFHSHLDFEVLWKKKKNEISCLQVKIFLFIF